MRPDAELCVGDLMSIEPIVVRQSESIDRAERMLRDHDISGLPVVDDHGVLVGVFSQTDALHLRRPGVAEVLRSVFAVHQVGDVMSRPAITVNRLASIADAARVMVDHGIHRVVATDDVGRPIGVLSSMDFVRLVAEA